MTSWYGRVGWLVRLFGDITSLNGVEIRLKQRMNGIMCWQFRILGIPIFNDYLACLVMKHCSLGQISIIFKEFSNNVTYEMKRFQRGKFFILWLNFPYEIDLNIEIAHIMVIKIIPNIRLSYLVFNWQKSGHVQDTFFHRHSLYNYCLFKLLT